VARTVHRLTEKGDVGARDWWTDLIAVPGNEIPAFGAGLPAVLNDLDEPGHLRSGSQFRPKI
jgi:hypothetical protein